MSSAQSTSHLVHSTAPVGSAAGAKGAKPKPGPVNLGGDSSRAKDYVTTITILESIRDAIFILNQHGKIEYANRGALELLRTDSDDLVGRFIDEVVMDSLEGRTVDCNHTQKQSNRSQGLIGNLNRGIFGDIEASLINNGNIVPVSLNFSVIGDANGGASYIILIAKDISHRKILEQELRQQQALSVSRDRLRSLGELSVGLAHEMSQPLATLKLRVEMMRSFLQNYDLQKHEIAENPTAMLSLIDRMSATIQNIRTFAQQTEDDTIAMVNINRSVESACDLVSCELKKRGIKLTLAKEEGLPYVIANPLWIEQVFVNLLTNARDAFDQLQQGGDHPEKGNKEIKIATRAIAEKWVEITVEDNAGGIAANIRGKIFDPFFTTKEPGKNSGVGLSILKNIVTSLGGDIKVTVKEGKGSVFRVRIPICQGEERVQLLNLIEMLHQN